MAARSSISPARGDAPSSTRGSLRVRPSSATTYSRSASEASTRAAASCAPSTSAADVLGAIDVATRVVASDRLRAYIVALLQRTREDARTELGASPRAGLMLLRAAKARALLHGRDHALPDDVQELANVVLAHRIMLVPEAAGVGRSEIVADAIASTPAL